MSKDKIKQKINALLSKTVENGASEAEAMAAIEKAHELMLRHFIDEAELKDPFVGEKCVVGRVERVKSGYNLTIFLANLARTFDCHHYYSNVSQLYAVVRWLRALGKLRIGAVIASTVY